MDLNTIKEIKRPQTADSVTAWDNGYAWLAGGTWLFSEPQVNTHTLIDLETLKWPSLTASPAGLEIAATCKVIELDRFAAPADWKAAPLFSECCRSFLASFKIWNEATVGGNLIMSLPAGPMISLTAALEGVCTLWPRQGTPRQVPVVDFVTGNHQNILAPGELLRSIHLPASALKKTHAFRRFTLTHLGRSEVLIIGTRDPASGEMLLTVTASTLRPLQFHFQHPPSAADVKSAIEARAPIGMYLEDTHGSREHRRHLTYYFSEQIRQELFR
ncbi:MAG: FAD binding domain-containing protein [Verrucomicrobiae bacterium]|nr:FAD binding domain-containing protein [Verrucomicrobiae bacterium]